MKEVSLATRLASVDRLSPIVFIRGENAQVIEKISYRLKELGIHSLTAFSYSRQLLPQLKVLRL